MNLMTKKLYAARSPRIAARKLGENMLIMSAEDSNLFTLNPVATLLWQSIDGVTPLDEIVERRICSEFEVQRDEALRDAEALAQDLASHGLMLLSDQPITKPTAQARA
jgi:hypothetical protein